MLNFSKFYDSLRSKNESYIGTKFEAFYCAVFFSELSFLQLWPKIYLFVASKNIMSGKPEAKKIF